jgi:hypothetical protein
MPDTPPDHLSNNPRSPFFQEDVLKRDIGVRFNGVEKTNVEEYCVSEGWVRVEVGKTKDRYGNPMTIRLNGKVEPYFKDQKTEQGEKPEKSEEEPKTDDKAATAQESAAAKTSAKAEKPPRADKAEKAPKAQESAKAKKPATAKKSTKAGKAEKAKKAKPKKIGTKNTKKKKK